MAARNARRSRGHVASLQAKVLKPLFLFGSPKVGVASTISIMNATPGSTISLQSGALPAGMTLNSSARTITGTPTASSTASFTLRETLGGATGSPKDTALSATVALAPPLAAREPFLGQIANNCRVPNSIDTNQTKQMSWSGHRILAPYTGKLKIGFANWYARSNNSEANGGGAATMRSTIITPYGVYRGYSALGIDTIVGADGANIEFEFDVALPVGTPITVAAYRECAGGVLYSQVSSSYVLNPDRSFIYSGGAATDLTGQSAPSYSATEDQRYMFHPIYIAGMTTTRSVIVYGDSRDVGTADRMTARDYDIGQIGRSLGAQGVPYISASVSGESLFGFLSTAGSNSVKRRALSAYVTHQCLQLGINDLNATANVPVGFRTTAMALLDQSKPIIIPTIPPYNTSSDSFVTTANQTVNANEASRVALNNDARTRAGIICWEIADVIETNAAGAKTRNGGRWGCLTATGEVGSSGRALTADGVHDNRECNMLYARDSGAVRANSLA